MMIRGKGGNRRSFDNKYNPNSRTPEHNRDRNAGSFHPYKTDFASKEQKTEWVSYQRGGNNTEKTIVKNEPRSEDESSNIPAPGTESIKEGTFTTKENNYPNGRPDAQTKDKSIISTDTPSSPSERPHVSSNFKNEETPQRSIRYVGKQGEKKFSGRCRLFIANMNNGTSEEELRTLFSEFGETGELYINKDKGFGFIRLDYRHNAEMAKSALDKKMFKGRVIQVRFATHASAVELHGLDLFASNEYIENAMSQFGTVERAVVVCDDRGRSKGYAIVEFEWKKSAQKVLDRFKEEMFVLGRLPKPVFAKPRTQQDEEEGLHENEVEKDPATKIEREFSPRFISPSSFEYTWAKKWRDLYIEEEDKKAKLEQELRDSRYALEMEMEGALREQEAVKIREELQRRQEELRRIEEDMRMRHEMTQRTREQIDRNRSRIQEERRQDSPRHSRDGPPRNTEHFPMRDDVVRQNDIILQQQAELEMRRGELLRAAGVQPGMLGIRPDMIRPGMPAHLGVPIVGLPGVVPPGPRGPPPGMPMHGFVRPHMIHGPPRRDFPPRGGGRFDHKRPRRE